MLKIKFGKDISEWGLGIYGGPNVHHPIILYYGWYIGLLMGPFWVRLSFGILERVDIVFLQECSV